MEGYADAGSEPPDPHIVERPGLGEMPVVAPVGTADPVTLRIPAGLVTEFPFEHQDLLAAPVGMAPKMGARAPAHQCDVLGIAVLGVQGSDIEALRQTRPPWGFIRKLPAG